MQSDFLHIPTVAYIYNNVIKRHSEIHVVLSLSLCQFLEYRKTLGICWLLQQSSVKIMNT